MKTTRILILVFTLIAVCPFPALAGDATSFNPTSVPIRPQNIGGIAVCTIVTWSSPSNPPEAEKYLDCNGQAFSPAAYPELAALYPAGMVPDYRGMFLRGEGGNSAALGVIQEDAGRNVTGEFTADIANVDDNKYSRGAIVDMGGHGPGDAGDKRREETRRYSLDASRQWGANHTANEFRPVNVAVRYLIRALP